MQAIEIREKFAQRLRELRKAVGMTQKEVADCAGISVGYLSDLERAAKSPSLETIISLAGALSIPSSDLLPDAPEPDIELRALQKWIKDHRRISLEEIVKGLIDK